MTKKNTFFIRFFISSFLLLSASGIFAQEVQKPQNLIDSRSENGLEKSQNALEPKSQNNLNVEQLLHNSEGVFWIENTVADYHTGCYGHYDLPKIENLDQNKKLTDSKLFIRADKADYVSDKLILSGDLSIKLNNLQISADSAKLDLLKGIYQIDSKVNLVQNQLFLQAQNLNLNTNTNNAKIASAHFIDNKSKIHAAAEHMQTIDNKKIILSQGVFTTCPPKNKSWHIKASQIELDREDKSLSATNVRFYLGEIPVFYFPWLYMSLDKSRKTGFLTPNFRYSSSNGFDIALPFYINIHPQADATIIPRYVSERGFLFQSESRYLLTNRVFGEFKIGYLNSDKKANLSERWFLNTKHSGFFGNHFNYLIDFSQLSDVNLARDLRLEKTGISASQVLQLVELNSYWQNWNLVIRARGYQTLSTGLKNGDPSFGKKYNFFNLVKGRTKDQGYYQLPQILLEGSEKLTGALSLNLVTELNYFDKLLDSKLNPSSDLQIQNNIPIWDSPSALRFVLAPTLKAEFKNSWGFLNPSLGFIYTYTRMMPRKNSNFLTQIGELDSKYANLHKLVPSLDIKMGLTLERLEKVNNVEYLQSLSPQLYLGYTPYINNKIFNQSFSPFIFDGSESVFSEEDLFTPNRLRGYDRIGDKTIITLALNHKWLRNKDLNHKFSFDFIQGFYPTRRKIGKIMMEDVFDKTRILSPFITKINWNIRDDLLWSNLIFLDWQSINSLRFFERAESSLSWNNSFMNLAIAYLYASEHSKLSQADFASWSYKANSKHQLSASGIFNLSNNWRLFAKYVRYLSANIDQKHLVGLEYNNCCWQIQLLYSDNLASEPSYNKSAKKFTYAQRDYSFMFNINFKGLGSAGDNVNAFLESEISSFRRK